ncbi:methyltransferase family protein [Sphingomonas sp. 37zxx]|uniref:methyltransferase family protein n=1 Tax=Sphingomonas sp. 37zxx TaxID=1550073 RepID=UPI0009DCA3E0|nr:isoprenylcysteine carboxylmethyltransferase family protein [Sphingomonas sp. 37zxx]
MAHIATFSQAGLRRLDRVERIALAAIYVFLLYRFIDSLSDNKFNLVYLVAEGLVMIMVLCRRSTNQISIAPLDWAAAFGGSFIGMMMTPSDSPAGPVVAAVAPVVMLSGLAISILAKVQLRRSFGIVAANRGLKTRGAYGLVRHPMYLGYFLIYFGMLAMNATIWNAAVVCLWSILQLVRITAEERLLGADPAYRLHAQHVRYRLLPGVY